MNQGGENLPSVEARNRGRNRNSGSTGAIKQKKQRDNQADVEKRIIKLLTGKIPDNYKQGITCARIIENEVRKLKKENEDLKQEVVTYKSAVEKFKCDREKFELEKGIFLKEKIQFLEKEARFLQDTKNSYPQLGSDTRNAFAPNKISDTIMRHEENTPRTFFQDAGRSPQDTQDSTATVPEAGVISAPPNISESQQQSPPVNSNEALVCLGFTQNNFKFGPVSNFSLGDNEGSRPSLPSTERDNDTRFGVHVQKNNDSYGDQRLAFSQQTPDRPSLPNSQDVFLLGLESMEDDTFGKDFDGSKANEVGRYRTGSEDLMNDFFPSEEGVFMDLTTLLH